MLSTVNVQHLESLNDRVAELTGVRVRETIPDAVLGERRRGRPDRPHARGAARPPARRQGLPAPSAIDAALNNFFRIENLAALREVALRQVAEEVEAKRLIDRARRHARRRRSRDDAPQAVGERLLALVEPYPGVPAARAARVALGAAPRRRARPAVGRARRAARPSDEQRALARRAARARLACSARTCSSRRPTTSPTAVAARRAERGHDLRPDGPRAPGRAGSRRLRTPAAPATDGAPARRRRAHRRRPRRGDRRRPDDASSSRRPRRSRRSRSGSPPASPARRRDRAPRPDAPAPVRRILLPFTGPAISRRALEAARAPGPGRERDDHARLPRARAAAPAARRAAAAQCERAMPLLEAIEQRAAALGVPVDARVEPRALLPRRAAPAARARALRPGRSCRRPTRPGPGLDGDDLAGCSTARGRGPRSSAPAARRRQARPARELVEAWLGQRRRCSRSRAGRTRAAGCRRRRCARRSRCRRSS